MTVVGNIVDMELLVEVARSTSEVELLLEVVGSREDEGKEEEVGEERVRYMEW
jgi:hypothetical protein